MFLSSVTCAEDIFRVGVKVTAPTLYSSWRPGGENAFAFFFFFGFIFGWLVRDQASEMQRQQQQQQQAGEPLQLQTSGQVEHKL